MKNILLASFVLFLIACSPRVKYFGEEFSPVTEIEVFYDERDVRKDFKVMGLMSADNSGTIASQDDLKKSMIEKAKAKGADAIVFLNIYSNPTNEFDMDDKMVVDAKLLRYY